MTDNPLKQLQREARRAKTARAEVAGGVSRVFFADLPATASEGSLLYVRDGLKTGQTTGNGTGVPVYFSDGAWRVFYDDSVVSN